MPNSKDILQITRADEVARQIHLLYLKTLRQILGNVKDITIFDDSVPFNINEYPQLKITVDKALNKLTANSVGIINNATEQQWLDAWKKNQGIAGPYLKRGLLTEAQQLAYTNKNLKALATFQKRKIGGLGLSDKIWKYNNQFKGEIEMGIDVALGKGQSAQALSRKIRANLKNPENLFRRIRNKHGNLYLSKAMKKYHPGGGVYRSSYKNAMRLARTEVNMAYRASDFEQYQQFDFVQGFEVKRSNRYFGCDICKELKGIYPKNFKFIGWHPQCRCYSVPILNSEKDFILQQKAILNDLPYKQSKTIGMNKKFMKWYNGNKTKINSAKNLPYFIKDNTFLIKLGMTPVVNLMKIAKASSVQLEAMANSLAKRFGGYSTGISLKKEDSIARKMISNYNGDITKITDAVRTTVIIQRDKMASAIAYINELKSITRVKVQTAEKYIGYSGVLTNFKTSEGLIGEILINTDKIIFGKSNPKNAKKFLGVKRWNQIQKETGLEGGLGHKYYEEWRLLNSRIQTELKRMKEIEKLSIEYYNKLK